jgi:predicted O-methyltransferase YrrM
MRELVRSLAPMWPDLVCNQRYHATQMYAASDAAVYQSMLRRYRPNRVLEVGSGFSTAVALDTIDNHHLPTRMTCIEPHPDRLQSLVRPDDTIELLELPVQDAPPSVFSALESGDFLFIDSTHVAKAGSDVVWLFLHVLPTLASGVIVHVHDIFWPLEYHPTWLSARQDWNEIYLVHAFLSGNRDWRILLFNDLVWLRHPDLIQQFAPSMKREHPGGLWLQKHGGLGAQARRPSPTAGR